MTSPNGWTDDFLCLEWFKKSFIPQAKAHADPNFPIILILDGHGSHVAVKMIETAIDYNIHLFCLPPHTTHRLQPLDVGVFGPLQRAWVERCGMVAEETGMGITKASFVKEYMSVQSTVFTENVIQQAWHKTGIYPFNPDIFMLKGRLAQRT
jgi:hypothetical protein